MSERVLVAAQLLLILLIVIPLPLFLPPWYAILIFLLGEAILFSVIVVNKIGNWSILPAPKPNAKFVRGGIYRIVRHPMYLGLLVFLLSIILWQPSWLKVLSFMILIIVLVIKIQHEERHLAKMFYEWPDYVRETPFKLIPKVW